MYFLNSSFYDLFWIIYVIHYVYSASSFDVLYLIYLF